MWYNWPSTDIEMIQKLYIIPVLENTRSQNLGYSKCHNFMHSNIFSYFAIAVCFFLTKIVKVFSNFDEFEFWLLQVFLEKCMLCWITFYLLYWRSFLTKINISNYKNILFLKIFRNLASLYITRMQLPHSQRKD